MVGVGRTAAGRGRRACGAGRAQHGGRHRARRAPAPVRVAARPLLVTLRPPAERSWPSLADWLGGVALAASALSCAVLLGLLGA
jgi:hypothetical protein